jgi:hypothetical protein
MLRRWMVEKVVCSARKWLRTIDKAIGLWAMYICAITQKKDGTIYKTFRLVESRQNGNDGFLNL